MIYISLVGRSHSCSRCIGALSDLRWRCEDVVRALHQIAIQEHDAALDAAGLKHQESLEKQTLELKEAGQRPETGAKSTLLGRFHPFSIHILLEIHCAKGVFCRYAAAALSREAAGEALEQHVGLKTEQSRLELTAQHAAARGRWEASAEAERLWGHLATERLAAELRAARQDEALQAQRHGAALQALEARHQAALQAAERRIQGALERHRVGLDARYKGEAAAWPRNVDEGRLSHLRSSEKVRENVEKRVKSHENRRKTVENSWKTMEKVMQSPRNLRTRGTTRRWRRSTWPSNGVSA